MFQFGIASRRPSASARQGQRRAIRPLWIVDCGLSGDAEPQEVFLVVQRCWADRSTSRLAAVKLARVRSHFHITQPDQPGG